MKAQPLELKYEVQLGPGEQLTLPRTLLDSVGPGRWLVTVQPIPPGTPIRDHAAFLRGYGPEDEDLYDDCPAG